MDGRGQIRHGVGEENKRKREKERESHVWLVSTSWWKEISNCIDACRREWEKDTPTIYLYVGGGNTRGFPPKKEYLFFILQDFYSMMNRFEVESSLKMDRILLRIGNRGFSPLELKGFEIERWNGIEFKRCIWLERSTR